MNDQESNGPGKKQRVLVNVILDKSGSMSSKVQDVIGGFNLYIDELAKDKNVEYGFSLTLFDTAVALRYQAVPLAKVEQLSEKTYHPSGNTALLDAIGNTVQTLSTDNYDKMVTVIMTDGEENSSREWTPVAVRELIQAKEKLGNWTFVFLGANIDAFAQGERLGVLPANAVCYERSSYRDVYDSLAANTQVFSASPAKSVTNFFKEKLEGIRKSS
jgi:uncharacterized protein YegL